MTLLDSEQLNELIFTLPGEESDWTGVKVKGLANEYVDTTRWYNIHEFVWQENDDKMYGVLYEVPATEIQEVDEPVDISDVYEVVPQEVTVIKYVKK